MKISPGEYTPHRVRKFLNTYSETGSATAAAKMAAIRPATHYSRLASDPGYRQAFEEAQQQVIGLLEDEAFRRALAGSDELLIFLLRGWLPARYQEHTIHEHSGSITVSEATGAAREVVRRLIPMEKLQ